jgi:hypothetical protein
MRLINTNTFELELFLDSRDLPQYAALSHRWGADEVSYEDVGALPLSERRLGESKGVDKILNGLKQARKDHLDYFWVDTCMLLTILKADRC